MKVSLRVKSKPKLAISKGLLQKIFSRFLRGKPELLWVIEVNAEKEEFENPQRNLEIEQFPST